MPPISNTFSTRGPPPCLRLVCSRRRLEHNHTNNLARPHHGCCVDYTAKRAGLSSSKTQTGSEKSCSGGTVTTPIDLITHNTGSLLSGLCKKPSAMSTEDDAVVERETADEAHEEEIKKRKTKYVSCAAFRCGNRMSRETLPLKAEQDRISPVKPDRHQ